MKKIFLISLLGLISCGPVKYILTEKELSDLTKKAYFEGQKDAIQGDIRIRLIPINQGDSTFIWIKSPWKPVILEKKSNF